MIAAEDPSALKHPKINERWRWEHLSSIYQRYLLVVLT